MAKFTAEQQAQRAYDMYQIKNVMGRHAYYHSWSLHPDELANIWSKRDDVAWGNSFGFHYGRDVLYDYYAKPQESGEQENGVLFMHTLTTPLIEVAEDGQTAQAMWYTPGFGCGPDGGLNWMHERYAVDFIKEDGEWKIWHLFVGTDFSFAFGTQLSDPRPASAVLPLPKATKSPKRACWRFPASATPDSAGLTIPPSPPPTRPLPTLSAMVPNHFLRRRANK